MESEAKRLERLKAQYEETRSKAEARSLDLSVNHEDEVKAADAWEALAGLYGELFTRSFGDEPIAAWKFALAGLTRKEIGRGLRHVIDQARNFPPSAPVFRKLCLTLSEEEARILRDRDVYRALPETKEEREARIRRAEKHLARCWKAIGGKPNVKAKTGED